MKTSIIILTHNELAVTQDCLDSIRRHTPEEHEVIVVDNGSTDGTVAYLRSLSDVIVHENQENLGFAKGCNQGIELSSGDNLLFLNNDTLVTAHWLENMLRVLYEDEWTGMVGPVTNYSSGHQRIPVTYTDIGGLDDFAHSYCQASAGRQLQVRRLVGFCLLVKREVIDQIGGFDERYGLGNYEDDDLCLRAIRKGYRLKVVQDSFIHHIGHATMRQLKHTNLRILLQQNALEAESKWGTNIYNLIYNAGATVSAVWVGSNAEPYIRQVLAPLVGHVEEIVVVDLGSTDQTVEIARQYTDLVYPLDGDSTNLRKAYRYGFERTKQEYLLWLYGENGFSRDEIRELDGLKLSLMDRPDIVALPRSPEKDPHLVGAELLPDNLGNDGQTAVETAKLFRREAGFRLREQEDAEPVGITISLCMIVRNEEDAIGRCLSSVTSFVDEINIIDTGSTDQTKEIAAGFGARIFDFTWIDDFAAARNFSFSKATCEYILWLDADDMIQEKDQKLLLELKKTLPRDVLAVNMHYHLAVDGEGNPINSLRRNRLVRREANFQWIGPVHEYLAVGGKTIMSDAAVTHAKNKVYTDRNLKIYQNREAAGEIFSPRDQYYYANELRDHLMNEKAIEMYKTFLDGKQGWVEDNIQACMKLADCYARLNDKDNQLAAWCRSMVYDKPRAECSYQMGAYFMTKQQYNVAIDWFERAIANQEYEKTLMFYNRNFSTWMPHLQLCVCYDRMGQFDKANEHNERALELQPGHPSMLYNREYLQKKVQAAVEAAKE